MVHVIVANSSRESPSVASNSEQRPLCMRSASMTVTTIADCWLVKIIDFESKEIKVASLGKKFVGKIYNILDPLNVLKW